MRIWEVDDIKALPGDIVREQDFIMRLRHLQRQGAAMAVINIAFGAHQALQTDVEKRETIARHLTPEIVAQNGQVHVMSQGDIFVIAPDADKAAAAIAAAFAAQDIASPAEQAKLQQRFHLPQDYAAIRERTNHYIEAARAAAQIGLANPSPEMALQNEQVRGPLTPWALDQIVKLFAIIDVRRYVRSQNIYRHANGSWEQVGAEYFVSVEELRRERFPRLDIRTPERLFMELCSELDYRLLNAFVDQPSSLANGPLNLNVAVDSVLGSSFSKFVNSLPPAQRQLMTFEINRGDMLLNFEATMAAITALQREGFKVALDALHPSMLPYINLAAFNNIAYLKVRMGKDMLHQIMDPIVLRELEKLPREKVIFYRCDDEAALALGKKLGISLFQGWYIDDIVGAKETPSAP